VIRHQENGLLVDFFSPTAIADSVDYAFEHPEQMLKLRKAARQTVLENYTHANGIAAYKTLLTEVTGLAC
jgi:glycosyltransferase involved in cell wall biosynthesis